MFPRKSVPESLKAGPVPRAQALAAGVGAAQLRGPWRLPAPRRDRGAGGSAAPGTLL